MNYLCELRHLALGGEKRVHRGECVETGLPVALKFLIVPYTWTDLSRFAAEMDRMCAAREMAGPAVAAIIEWYLERDPPFFVEEYFPEGTLAGKMNMVFQQGRRFKLASTFRCGRQILVALRGIHLPNQIHRDVRPSNFLVRGRELVSSDMGIGRTLDRSTTLQTRAFCGTRGYLSPEQGLGLPVNHCADLYAVGIILHEMLTGKRGAWNHCSYAEHSGVRHFLEKLLVFNRTERFANSIAAMVAIDRIQARMGEVTRAVVRRLAAFLATFHATTLVFLVPKSSGEPLRLRSGWLPCTRIPS